MTVNDWLRLVEHFPPMSRSVTGPAHGGLAASAADRARITQSLRAHGSLRDLEISIQRRSNDFIFHWV